jgi:tetratricopeptide (TPR) repeat protein
MYVELYRKRLVLPMEKTACYCVAMPSRGGARVRIAAAMAMATALLAVLSLGSCTPPSPYFVGNASDRKELSELFGLLREAKGDPALRYAILRRISSNLIRQREYGTLAALLTSQKDSSDSVPFDTWRLFTAAYAYEEDGSSPIAAIYYDRVLRTYPDVTAEGESLHRECLERLTDIVDSPERRIGYYKESLARFPDRDAARNLFMLAKEYERGGEWEMAVKTYSEFLPFFGTEIPGYPDAFRYARDVVNFRNSPKDWAYGDLQTLAGKIRDALAAGDAARLRSYRARIGFFTALREGEGEERQPDERGLADMKEFMSGGRVQASPELDMSANGREAYLKTWGWTDKITTWYLYFRRIYFPANPNVHGSWEWAGIYFGEKTP